MEIGSIGEAQLSSVEQEGAVGVSIAWLLDVNRGAPNFAMRLFRIEPGGCTPRHTHSWEHEVYVIGGSGRLWAGDQWTPLGEGSYVLVLPDEEHQFACAEGEQMQLLCMIPNES
jgi:quercetin dioxygenase-like cupin family protein